MMRPIPSPALAAAYGSVPHTVNPYALALNESPFPPLPAVRAALIRSIDAANRYPEFLPEQLRDLIARRVGVDAKRVVLGSGATGVVMQALQALSKPGDTVVMSVPTFEGYPIMAEMVGLTQVAVPLDAYGRNDLDGLAEASAGARVVVMCRPHNPTGTIESTAAVLRFLRQVPRDTIVLLDEAYIEFVAAERRLDLSTLTARFPNVLALRTFSKAYGLAGLRIGYGVASEELARVLWGRQLPFGLAITALPAVAASYAADDQLAQRIRAITSERRDLRTRLSELGVATTDTHANFIYMPSRGGHGQPWRDVFADTRLNIRLDAAGGARVTVGGRASSRAVLAAVEASP